MIPFLLIFFAQLLPSYAHAEDSHCGYFKYCGSSRSSNKSHPSSSSSANFNPSTISSIKGVGIETLFQPNNPLGFNLVTGNGKVGGAVISPTMENSFFGNRSIEVDEVYLQRREDGKRYKNKKINLALGANFADKKNYSLDVGLSFKRNPDVKKINPGVAATLRLWNVNLGAYVFKDDTKIELKNYLNPYSEVPYFIEKNSDSYTESFIVSTFSVGTSYKNLSVDFGVIRTKYNFYPEDTFIRIYSLAYSHKNFLFNAAFRNEYSSNAKERAGFIYIERTKKDAYAGVQYMFSKHVITGVGYNNFLLNEWSMTLTLFL